MADIVGAMSLLSCVFVFMLLWPELPTPAKVFAWVVGVVLVGLALSMVCSPEEGPYDLRREYSLDKSSR